MAVADAEMHTHFVFVGDLGGDNMRDGISFLHQGEMKKDDYHFLDHLGWPTPKFRVPQAHLYEIGDVHFDVRV